MNKLEEWLGKAVLFRWAVVAIIILIAMIRGYYIITASAIKESALPVYGERNSDSTDHTIGNFSVIDQDGKTITQDDFKDKIYVADFFFTTCQGICPKMSDQMERIAFKYKNNKKVMLLSHTAKPDEDSVPALKSYSKLHHADSTQWHFVTADKKVIENLAKKSYLLGGSDENAGPGFVHTQFVALIDPEKRIRGFYDATDSMDVNKLIGDIDILLKEE